MNEKPNTQSYYVRWDLLVLLAFFLVKFAQSTAMEQDRFDARLIRPHSWSGQVRLKRQKSLLRVPECAAFLFYSFSVIHQAQFLPEVNGREFDIIKNESNYINRHYKEGNDLIRFQMI